MAGSLAASLFLLFVIAGEICKNAGKMELGIKAKDIMEDNFPILDSSLTLEKCMRKLNNNQEACLVLHNGSFYSIVSYNELLNAFLKRKTKNIKLYDLGRKNNFVKVKPETDILEIIKLMRKKNKDFVVVKDKNYFGLITKKEIAENNQLLFDEIVRI